ncbi:hypothetical protein [Streptomyces sp. NPDC056723]|uniref:hypothetical protein n=1 Tax=unclassified Streptomyces TaxID=2593676 RepID=UPI0036821B45
MPKTWKPGDAKRFARQVELGRTYYYVQAHATNLGAYEDSHTYSKIVFDKRSPITGNPMSGSLSAAGLCQRYGPVYEEPPAGLRDIAGPAPQVAGPLPAGYEGILDEAELRGLDKHNSRSLPPNVRRALNARRP